MVSSVKKERLVEVRSSLERRNVCIGLSPVIVCVGSTLRDVCGTRGNLVVVVVESKFSDHLWL
jgi:hypothetical protein